MTRVICLMAQLGDFQTTSSTEMKHSCHISVFGKFNYQNARKMPMDHLWKIINQTTHQSKQQRNLNAITVLILRDKRWIYLSDNQPPTKSSTGLMALPFFIFFPISLSGQTDDIWSIFQWTILVLRSQTSLQTRELETPDVNKLRINATKQNWPLSPEKNCIVTAGAPKPPNTHPSPQTPSRWIC